MAVVDPPAAPDRTARGSRLVTTTKTAFAETVLAPDALRTVFQPIVRCDGDGCRVYAQECLTRGPAGTAHDDMDALFAAARQWGLEAALDRARVTAAVETVSRSGIGSALFIHVRPATLMVDAGFPDFIATTAAGNGIDWTRLTVAVTEQARDCDAQALAPAIRALKVLGMRVALDGYGAGTMDVRPLENCACGPHLVKLDGPLFQAAGQRSFARHRVEGIVSLAQRLGIDVIAAAVDRDVDLRLASRLGIELVQGHYLSGPLSAECVMQADLMLCDLARSA